MVIEGDRRVAIGRSGEAMAERYLANLGYRLLARRYRLRGGEIDLVMEDGATLVFVEVRRRRSGRGGDPLESISPRKRSRIIRAARLFLNSRRLEDRPCRFDVVGVRDREEGEPVIAHVVDAFRADWGA